MVDIPVPVPALPLGKNYGKESRYVPALRMTLSFALTKDFISILVSAFIFDLSIHQIWYLPSRHNRF